MPAIRSVKPIYDGLQIEKSDGTILQVTYADIPNQVKNGATPADIDNWINNTFLPNRLTYVDTDGITQWMFYAQVHTYSLNPWNVIAAVSDYPITGEWW